MSYVIAVPELVTAAATDLARIESTLGAANAAAAAPMTGVLAAGADEVSAVIAAMFGAHGHAYQALSAQAALFHKQFVQAMNAGAGSYASAEAANASPLQAVENAVLGVINAPTEALAGRPLIANGADAAAGSGLNGGDAGILIGNGGNGGSGVVATSGAGGNGGAAGLLWGRGGSGGPVRLIPHPVGSAATAVAARPAGCSAAAAATAAPAPAAAIP